MSQEKTMDRRSFLTSAVSAWAAVTLGACIDDPGTGGTGGTAMGGTGGTDIAGTGGESPSTGGATGSTGGATGSTGGATGSTGGATGSTGGATGSTGGATADASVDDGATGGGTYTCTTNTDNGDHSHPLNVPGSDVERGYQDTPYTLEDGGTGHTHTLMLSAYEFFYLQSGMMISVDSSTDSGHNHPCVVSCAQG